jgi:hypothetical protein
MKVQYIYCHRCGYEQAGDAPDIDVKLGGNYPSGQTVICPNCAQETSDFDKTIEDGPSLTQLIAIRGYF